MPRTTTAKTTRARASTLLKRARRVPRKIEKSAAKKKVVRKLKANAKKIPVPSIPFKTSDSTVIMDPSVLARLPPELAFQAGIYAPGRTATPYVINEEAVNVRTGVATGQCSLGKANTTTLPHFLITFNPVASSLYTTTPSSGILAIDVADNTTILPTDLVGSLQVPLTDLYGLTTNFADTMLHYATEYQVVVDTPEVQRSGEVFIGQIPFGSFQGGISITALVDQAHKMISAKEANRYSTTVRVVNRDALLRPGLSFTQSVQSEMVSYMIFRNYARNITTGDLSKYSIEIKTFTNYIYQPDGSTPVLSGLVKPTVTSERQSTPAETSASQQLSHINGSNEAAKQSVVEGIMKMGLGLLKSIPGLSSFAKVVNGVSSAVTSVSGALMAQDDNDYPARLRDEIAWTQWMGRRCQIAYPRVYPPEVEDLLNELDNNIASLEESLTRHDKEASMWLDYLTTVEHRVETTRHGTNVLYLHEDTWVPKSALYQRWLKNPSYQDDAIDPLTGRMEQPAPVDQSFQTMRSNQTTVSKAPASKGIRGAGK